MGFSFRKFLDGFFTVFMLAAFVGLMFGGLYFTATFFIIPIIELFCGNNLPCSFIFVAFFGILGAAILIGIVEGFSNAN